MKEGIINVQLAKRPTLTGGQCYYTTNDGHFNNRKKGLLVIYALFLSKTLGNKTGFKPLKGTISFKFHFINSFAPNGFFVRR